MKRTGNELIKELTIREHFAIEVMKAMLNEYHVGNVEFFPTQAVIYADLLIKELNKES